MNKNIIKRAGLAFVAVAFAATSTVSAATLNIAGIEALLLGLGLTKEQATAFVASVKVAKSTGTETTTSEYVYAGVKKDFTFSLLKVGSRGEDVKALQTIINTGADGNFGPGTKKALMAWQKANNLVADGVAGAATRVELNKKTEVTVIVPATDSSTGSTTDAAEVSDNTVVGNKLVVNGTLADEKVIGKGQKVIFSKLVFTAGDKDVEIEDINVKVKGSADSDVLAKVILLDDSKLELEDDNIDRDDEAKLDVDIVVASGESLTLYVGGVMEAEFSGTGLDISVEVTSITTDGAEVEGDSVVGAYHEINEGITNDEFKVEISENDRGAKVGEKSVDFADIIVENKTNNEQKVLSIKLEKSGSAGDRDIENAVLKIGGKSYKASFNGDDEYTFDFGKGVKVEEDRDVEFNLTADLVEGDDGDTIIFAIKDIVVEDDNGVSIAASSDSVKKVTPVRGLMIGSTLISLSDTTDTGDGDIAAGSKAASLASFDMQAEGGEVEAEMTVTITVELDATDVVLGDLELDNIAIYKVDGTRISDREDSTFKQVTGSTTFWTDTVTFKDVVINATEEEVDYIVKADVDENTPTGTKYRVTYISVNKAENADTGDSLAVLTDTDTNDEVREVNGLSTQTVRGVSVTVDISNPSPSEINASKNDQVVAEIEIETSNSGDNVVITELLLHGSVTDIAPIVAGSEFTADDVDKCQVYNGKKKVTSDRLDLGTSMRFEIEDLVVAKDTKVTLNLKCDISDDAGNGDKVTITGASSTFDAEGENINTRLNNMSIETGNAETSIKDGLIRVTISSDEANDAKIVREGTNDVSLGKLEIEADEADIIVDNITVTLPANVLVNFDDKVEIYVNGNIQTGKGKLVATSMVFENLNITIENGNTTIVEFKVDTEDSAPAAPIAGSITVTTVTVKDGALGFSGTLDLSPVTVYETIPVITPIAVNTTLVSGESVDLFAYSIKADGDSDITLKSTLLTTTVGSATTIDSPKIFVYSDSTKRNNKAEVAFTSGLATALDLVIPDGKTWYVFLTAAVIPGENGSVIVRMKDDPTGIVLQAEGENGVVITGDKILESDITKVLSN